METINYLRLARGLTEFRTISPKKEAYNSKHKERFKKIAKLKRERKLLKSQGVTEYYGIKL